MAEQDPAHSLVQPPVHIAVDQEIHASRIIHLEDPEIMRIILSPGVVPVLKTVHQAQPVLPEIIAPELPLLDEADHVFLFVLPIVDRTALDAEIDLLVLYDLASHREDALCGPLIILQVHLSLGVLDAVSLRHLIDLLRLRILHPVIPGHRHDISGEIRKAQFLFRDLLHGHLAPDHRPRIGMDVHVSVIFPVRAVVRFQLPQKLMVRILLKCGFVKPLCKIHAFRCVVLAQIHDMGIKTDLTMLLRLCRQNEQIPLSLFHQIFKIQLQPDVFPVVLRRQVPAFLNEALPVQAAHFVGPAVHMGVVLSTAIRR